jgi:tRNA G18 (ribose-2'-O)-methylase SpoU
MRKLSGEALHRERQGRKSKGGPLIIADGLQVEENVGSIIRLGEAFAVRQITFLSDLPYKLARIKKTATSDAHLRVPWGVETKGAFLQREALSQTPLIAVELTDESVTLGEEEYPLLESCGFVIGSESHGISEEILDLCTSAITIPMWGINNSYNVSHALAIVLWEWRKQYPT